MSERRARAAAVLRAHGIDPDDLAALDAAAAFGALTGAEGPAVASALGELGDPRTGTLLRSLDAAETPAAVRKAIRRALHRLHERGIATPAPATALASAARAEPERAAWTSAVDGTGTRLVWVAAALPSGRWQLVAAELNEPGGLVDLRASETSAKQLRAARQQLRERGLVMVALPFATADALLVEGQQRRPAAERAKDYLRVRPRLTSAPPAAPEEPRSARVVAPAADEIDALVAGSAALLLEPELGLWWPTARDAAPFLEEIAALEDSPLVLSESQQESRLAAVLARAAAALYPRPAVARRLQATAYVLAETGRTEAARSALAVAVAAAADPAGARDIPLLSVLVHQGLGRLAAARAAERQTARRGSLVMTPAEALKARSAGRPPRTRS